MEMKAKGKLKGLLFLLGADDKFISVKFEIQKCKCGSIPDYLIFNLRFRDDFKPEYYIEYYCKECFLKS